MTNAKATNGKNTHEIPLKLLAVRDTPKVINILEQITKLDGVLSTK